MKRFFAIMITMSATMLLAGAAFAGEESKTQGCQNLSYQIMKIKHRANREFTNNGRVSYQYATDLYHNEIEPGDVGTLVIDKGSKIQNVYNAVELFERHHFQHNDNEPLNIGTVTDKSGNLKHVETYIKVVKPITY